MFCYNAEMTRVVIGITCAAALAAAFFTLQLLPRKGGLPSARTGLPQATSSASEARDAVNTEGTTTRATPNIRSLATTTLQTIKDVIVPDVGWKTGIATVFWVGEVSDASNGYIPNDKSAWDGNWQAHFGGVDDPLNRCGFQPCAFTPKENPFYVALPYNDLDDFGERKPDSVRIPWYSATATQSVLKNRWIEVRHKGTVCYGQWQDVGPFYQDDIEYVFGKNTIPKNQFGEKAGIDLSPALADCLSIDGSDPVEWRFVEASRVPQGNWTKIITTRK